MVRIGFLAAPPDLLEDFAQLKMRPGLTSSEFSERLACGALEDGRWRKHLRSLRERLAQAHQCVAQQLAAEQDILLGPGHLFTPDLQPSPWLRFNVAFTEQPEVLAFLDGQRRSG